MRIYSSIILFILILAHAGCGQVARDEYSTDAKPIADYLDKQLVKEQPHLKIKTNALDRNFIFYGSFIPMLKSATGHSLKGRVVKFQIFADRVIMLESPEGLSIANDDDSIILLAEFPIIERQSDGVLVDFARGMKSAFTSRNVHSRSLSEKSEDGGDLFKSIFLNLSFVKSIDTKDDVIIISQIAQWRNAQSELISAEFRYFLKEYRPSPDFKKMSFGSNRHVRYFSTPPQIKKPTTKPIAYMAKWDIAKPIIFHLSANTPENYKQALKDGILYWNHIFGREVLQVENLPPGIKAPHHKLNIIQWVQWDDEASAYADMVVDHLTGQTLQAQVYVHSGWIFKTIKKLKTDLQEMLLSEANSENIAAIEEGVPIPDMFDLSETCFKNLNNYQAIFELAQSLGNINISDFVLETLTKDIIRAVIAHEMGHVLGLRHNLASSTNGNISLEQRKQFLSSYLYDAKAVLGHEKYLSRSMMDVFSAADDALIGSQIRELMQDQDLKTSKLGQIYLYDKEAIAYGYLEQPMPGSTPFCTDEDQDIYLDCKRWDQSPTPALFAANQINSTMNQVAVLLSDTFIEALKPDREGGPLSIKDVPLSYQSVLKAMDTNLKSLFLLFNKNARLVQIESTFAALGPQNKDEIDAQRFKSLREQIDQAGLNLTLFGLVPPFRKASSESSELLKLFSNKFSQTLNEQKQEQKPIIISQAEIDQAELIALNFFNKLNEDLITVFAKTVAKMQFDDPDLQLPIEEALGKVALEIVLDHNNNNNPINPKILPVFSYSLATREAAALLLSPRLGLLADWSFDNLRDTLNKLKQLVRLHVGLKDNTDLDLGSLNREQRAWVVEQSQILSALAKARSMVRALNPMPEKTP